MTAAERAYIGAHFSNTALGLERIARNLGLDGDVVRHCRDVILSTPLENIEMRGKNYYFWNSEYGAVLTINRSSLGIITAKAMM